MATMSSEFLEIIYLHAKCCMTVDAVDIITVFVIIIVINIITVIIITK